MSYINIQSFDDIFISKCNSNRNFGFLPYLLVGENGGLDNFKKDINIALLKFKLTNIKNLSELKNADLFLYVNGKSSMCFNSNIPIQICKVDDDYISERTTWDTAPQMELTKYKINITNDTINSYIKINVKDIVKKSLQNNIEAFVLGLTGEKVGEIVSFDSSRGKNPPYLCLDNVEMELPEKKSRSYEAERQNDKRMRTYEMEQPVDKVSRQYESEQLSNKKMRTYDTDQTIDKRRRQFEIEPPVENRSNRTYDLEKSPNKRVRPFELDQNENRYRGYERESLKDKRTDAYEKELANDNRYMHYDSDNIGEKKANQYDRETVNDNRFRQYYSESLNDRRSSMYEKEQFNDNRYSGYERDKVNDKRMNTYEKDQSNENCFRGFEREKASDNKITQYDKEQVCDSKFRGFEREQVNDNRFRQFNQEQSNENRIDNYDKESLGESRFRPFEIETVNENRINPYEKESNAEARFRPFEMDSTSDTRKSLYEKESGAESRFRPLEIDSTGDNRKSFYEKESGAESRFRPFEMDSINENRKNLYEKEPSTENRFRPFEMDSTSDTRKSLYEKESGAENRFRPFEMERVHDRRVAPYEKEPSVENRFRPFEMDKGGKEVIPMNREVENSKYDVVPVQEVSVNNWKMDAALLIDPEENFDMKEVKKFNKMIEEMMPKYITGAIEQGKNTADSRTSYSDNNSMKFSKMQNYDYSDEESAKFEDHMDVEQEQNIKENSTNNINMGGKSVNYSKFILDKTGIMLDEGPVKLICQFKNGEDITIDIKSRKTVLLAPHHTYYISWSIGVDIPKSQNGDFGAYIALDGSPVTESMINFRYYSDCIGGFSTLTGSDIIATGNNQSNLQLIYLRENFTGNSSPIVQAATLNIFQIC